MKLVGKLCTLEAFTESHLPKVRGFLADREVMREVSTLHGDEAERFLSWIKRKDASSSACVFSILRSGASQNDLVGISLLRFVDPSHKRAVSGTILGVTELWGSGLAYESAILKLDHGFKTLLLERVYASATGSNERGKNLLERLGYQTMTSRPEGIKDNGHPNRSFYELTREKWVQSHP
jgi:RimJ/RimL family protein N-acetyltransferase